MNYTYKTISKVGHIRKNNEDSLGVYKTDDGLLTIVCDGLGGNNAGEVASRLAVDSANNHFINSPGDDYSIKIKSAIAEANRIILKEAVSDYTLHGMSTTIEMLFIKDKKAYTGHVGDSRIYFFTDDKLTQITKDHSYVQKLIDDGLLSQEEAEDHPNKHIITQALGDSDPVEADLDTIGFEPHKKVFFFSCTDGVSGVIDNKELQEIFRMNEIDDIADKISNLVEERGAPDNFSFALVKID